MSSVSRADILKLSVSERILLVRSIWDSIADSSGCNRALQSPRASS